MILVIGIRTCVHDEIVVDSPDVAIIATNLLLALVSIQRIGVNSHSQIEMVVVQCTVHITSSPTYCSRDKGQG